MDPAINARVKLINGYFDLPADTPPYMKAVREAISGAAQKIQAALPAAYDAGRVIAGLDKLQEAKDTLCVAAILPHAGKN